ncbi:MAG: hypothetical protein WA160_10475 [Pseudobdellovibrio sp.]
MNKNFPISLFSIVFAFVLLLSLPLVAKPKPPTQPPVQLQFSVQFILEQVLSKKNMAFKPDVKTPAIYMSSVVPLRQFQDAIEPQWGLRPDSIINAFIILKNEIYLLDEAAYYKKNNRCIDDSLAHELTHYIQSQYQGFDLNDDSLEADAIEIQTWFRETYCKE